MSTDIEIRIPTNNKDLPFLQREKILVQSYNHLVKKQMPIKHNVHTTQYVGNIEKQDLVFVLSVTKATRDDCLSFYFVL